MLRVKEVAKRLDVHPATVYRWIKEGHLEAVRYGKVQPAGTTGRGGALRISESSLNAVEIKLDEKAVA
ncbi:helix-turn-helix domain-containing protein [Streptomyces noursei]|uniref:helix-turn-helix domain-containing protein n=1 Tax=Streptomyces noursei TaxID=1971 RepID=UPI0019C1E815|nr:helix-turn-helix domain-containing protein [Streptomyces noursei]MCZ1013984.1 helix-turn-helix domain-containing protein [Streptomyces noursei]GGX40405.1 hypothetical protein GCM10010341_72880 [Streptomyces noursei]